MALSIGIIGLPNVGKSTLFNAFTKAQNAESANYPFCTIEPNKAIVPLPDDRLEKLATLVNPKNIIHSTIDFVDIAGLVKGASKGEGLGNQFLENIRQTKAILHVVRCFENDDIAHVETNIDPIRDIEIVETELILADMQMLERKIDRLSRHVKGDKSVAPLLEECRKVYAHLEQGKFALTYSSTNDGLKKQAFSDPGLVSAKKVIYCANVDEAGIEGTNPYIEQLVDYSKKKNVEYVVVSAQVEQDVIDFDDEEKAEFLESYGITESGIEKVVHSCFRLLGLASFFTYNAKEARAWTIQKGWKAPKAASVIHEDFERGFIRAEVISFEDFISHDGEAGCRDAGVLRTEGKEYQVADGDVIYFLFNV
ncbi:MAG: redox-regulated ATPase YchF [Calditrichaeota bacterium]|nr:MAG: redox-regulated ATPase YchF [Calditrichota bacterium]